jgi:hypothetical protein
MQMDARSLIAFYLIEQIAGEFSKFTGSQMAFAQQILRRYGLKVQFVRTPQGVVTSVDYDDLIRFFEAPVAFRASVPGVRLPYHNRTNT